MNLLAIDTSTDLATVALSVRGALYTDEQEGIRQHTQCVLPMIERAMASMGISFTQLDAIVFGRGPGSFTGLRIACSVAKGLAYAHDLPLFPVSSLAAIAEGIYQLDDDAALKSGVLAVIDARMQQLYWAYFSGQSFDVAEQVSSPLDLVCPGTDSIILAGVGFELYVPQCHQALQARMRQQVSMFPRAEAMIRLVLRGQINQVSATEALPVYVRNQITQGEFRG